MVFTVVVKKATFFNWTGNCQNRTAPAKTFVDIIKYHWTEDLPLCFAESTWMICHIIFRECTYNNLTKSWEYLPPCQETCDHYITQNKMCQKTALKFLHWSEKADSCASDGMFFLNCSLYPKRLSGNCQYIPFSKSLYFVTVLLLSIYRHNYL